MSSASGERGARKISSLAPDSFVMNGASSSISNGHSSPMESQDADETSLGLNRTELVRIIVQAMDSLGYSQSARSLEQEAGVEAMSPQMRRLRDCILNGRWDDLEAVLDTLTVFKSDADARSARFVLYEQKFLELLEARRTADALNCLRNNLTQLDPDPKLFNRLPLLCLSATPEEVRQHADWPGAGQASRTAVLEKLHKYIPPTHLLQENRLENLLCQTIEKQKRLTMFPYTRKNTISLLEDLEHCQDRIPRNILFRLPGHNDEVWFVQFSHRGEFLASASKDATVIIWNLHKLFSGQCEGKDAIHRKLCGHSQMVSHLSWSPDDTQILSCGNDRSIRLWNIESGECVRVFEKHSDQVSACAWMPNGLSFVSGSADNTILEWDATTGEVTGSYLVEWHVFDVAVSKDGSFIVATCSDKALIIFDTATKTDIYNMTQSASITSLYLAPDGETMLAFLSSTDNHSNEDPEIHVWNIRERRVVQKFKGYKQVRYVIRGCLGGHEGMLVLCGSEDNRLYIWERKSGDLIAKLPGHEGPVNTVACSETDENLFASGSDDKTVIVSFFHQLYMYFQEFHPAYVV